MKISWTTKRFQYNIGLLFLFAWLFNNCTSSEQSHEKIKANRTKNESITQLSDSLTIDLLALKAKGLLKNTQIVVVENDAVYHKTKKFNALSLKEIMEKYSSMKQLKAAETKVVFECVDGYKPEMPLEKLLSAKAFLAISDVDAPKGKEWTTIMKDNHVMIAEPFYVVYAGKIPKDSDYKFPYNLIKIHFAPITENEAFIKPQDSKALKGYELFKKSCQTCHAINKVGGKMGPELNYPKSVAEYWKIEDLKAYIKNPASYRNDVKMPKLGLSDADINEIVVYLSAMAKQKK